MDLGSHANMVVIGGGHTLESQVLQRLLQTGESCRIITLELHGVNLYKPLSETKKFIQVCPRVLFASLVKKKLSVKKFDLIRLYLNIWSLVPKFLAKEVFSPSRFN